MIFLLLFFFPEFQTAHAGAPGKIAFGPVTYEVRERYGADNVYRDNFKAAEGRLYVVKLQNGKENPERAEYMELKLNGESVLTDAAHDYPFIACVVDLKKENSLEVVLKDAKPSGFKRPALPRRFITVTVSPFDGKLDNGVYGASRGEDLADIAGLLQKISSRESASLASFAINLRNDVAARVQAMQRLSDRRDAAARPFITAVFTDLRQNSEIRAAAAAALGKLADKSSISALVRGMLDSDDKTRLASTRALSAYDEKDTREALVKMLERLDAIRRNSVIHSMIDAGWKPVETLLTLAESTDAHVSSTAIGILGSSGETRATELLLKLFQQPGRRDVHAIIAALGSTGDDRAAESLAAAAKDPARRAGNEAELGEALAGLGHQKSREVIAEMLGKCDAPVTCSRLQAAHRKVGGKEYR